jgi:multidrug transporter EmrE-like cation transporter
MTPFFTIFTLVAYTAVSVSGLTFLKLSDGNLFTLYGATGGVLYGVGFIVWYGILTQLPLSVAFPVAASLLVFGTQIAGYFFLREPIGIMHVAGLFFIVAGITMVSLAGGRS